LSAGDTAYSELLNLCVWTKNNPGMGSLYVLIRWGTFRFDLVGRLPILAAVTLIAALVGVKILVF
jgi:hypothetical protein